jgi:teichuronic acid biosynthesis glycosyltransferase TuaH
MPDQYGYDNEKLNIVMFNMSSFFDYDHGIVNRNYFIMKALEREERVGKIVAVDFLPIGMKKGIKHYAQNILLGMKKGEIVYGDLTSACYQRTDKIYSYSTVDSVYSLNTVARELRRVEKFLSLRNIVFWSYNPMFTEFIGKLNEKLFVFDTVDNWADHPSYTKLVSKKKLVNNYKVISDKADLIFTVSEDMVEFYEKQKRIKDVHWIPNGADFEHYNNPEKTGVKNELSKYDKPIIGYIGTISDRVDFDLVASIAESHKDKIVALCGPVWPVIKAELHKKLGKYDNIVYTGRIKYDQSPGYLSKFDVAIIPHKVDQFNKSTNPMKLYEYLSAGKPVVTTKGAGTEMFKDESYIAKSNEEFISLINKALEADNEQLQAKRRNAVRKHSWRARADRMVELMYKKLETKKHQ